MVAGALIGTFSNTRAQLVGSRVVLGIGTIFGSKSGLSLISRFIVDRSIYFTNQILPRLRSSQKSPTHECDTWLEVSFSPPTMYASKPFRSLQRQP